MSKSTMMVFGLEVNALVDQGQAESIQEVQSHFEHGDLTDYIKEKYKLDFPFDREGMDEVNSRFQGMSSYVYGNERRKFLIQNNGLCLIVAIALNFTLED